MISQTAEYALRAVVVLGAGQGDPLTTKMIADRTKAPLDYLSKVLQALGRAGLVDARRGIGGGYVLTRNLDDLTIKDVVDAVEPLRRITHCPLDLPQHAGRLCSLHKRLDDGIALIERLYSESTIGDLLRDTTQATPLCEKLEQIAPKKIAVSKSAK